ncbi:sulfatase-like hydrolase/transferase [Arenibacter palladensis]|uniref:sulfatase-like hydrolase/transferase n=1 Tax=Arenibacter palladensis TaxID=237373 RepID=UPI002FD1399A
MKVNKNYYGGRISNHQPYTLSIKVIFSIIILLSSFVLFSQKKYENIREPSDRPNFVFIVADDLGYGDLGFTGSTQIKTPNIDQLAQTGIFCTQGYVSSAVCSPSRAGFLTGINQVEFGHDNNLANTQPGFDPQFLGLPIEQKTIADYLKPLGYVSGIIGKWHLGYENQFHPLKRGFDKFWGYRGGGHDYFNSKPEGKGYMSPLESNYKTPQPITYITDDKGDECVDFIKRHKNEPFFLFASFNAPHTPMQATQADLALYGHIQDKKRQTYAAMVHRLDVNVGRIIDAIAEHDLDKNTLVVFISDNGGPIDNGSINSPYNGKKGTLLEGGLHVPFILNWPQTLPSGKTYSQMVSSLDFAPTFLALAGGNVKEYPFSGSDLIPHLMEDGNQIPHDNLMWRFTISAAIREGDYKLIRLPDRLPLLFHLPSDIAEQHNIALDNLDITRDLLEKLGNWDVSLPHPLFLEGAEWKKRQLYQYDDSYPLIQP